MSGTGSDQASRRLGEEWNDLCQPLRLASDDLPSFIDGMNPKELLAEAMPAVVRPMGMAPESAWLLMRRYPHLATEMPAVGAGAIHAVCFPDPTSRNQTNARITPRDGFVPTSAVEPDPAAFRRRTFEHAEFRFSPWRHV